jgi:hypothetical protein
MAGSLSTVAQHPARGLIDAALASGESPNAIAEQYADSLKPPVSRSAIYRYARGRRSPLTPAWVDGSTTVQEAARDLGTVRRDLLHLFADATARGADASAARLAREIAQVSAVLKRDYDVDTDAEQQADYVDQVNELCFRLLTEYPGALDFARTHPRTSDEMREDLDALAARFAKKEK